VVIEIHYPDITPGIGEIELEWAIYENQLNEGERLSRAEPEDWNLALKEQLTARVEQNSPDMPSCILSQRFHLPVDVGHFRIAARLRFYPYGRNKQVVGSEIALPEPERDETGAPKEVNGGWLKAETEGHRSGDNLWLYPVGYYGEPGFEIGGA
jgi:hypothetical protein